MNIDIQNLSYSYRSFGAEISPALRNINLSVAEGEFIAIVGGSGSGKTTLAQQFTGLLDPDSGRVLVDGIDIRTDRKTLDRLRQRIGLVFQFPETQLFGETIFEDIAFAPRNQQLDEARVTERVQKALMDVGITDKAFQNRSPFSLSAGEQRRVAIAGILAMQPHVMILDEPTAGLDANGRRALQKTIRQQHNDGRSVILISHDLELVIKLAKRVVVLHKGGIVFDGETRDLINRAQLLHDSGLTYPRIVSLSRHLHQIKMVRSAELFSIEEIIRELDSHNVSA